MSKGGPHGAGDWVMISPRSLSFHSAQGLPMTLDQDPGPWKSQGAQTRSVVIDRYIQKCLAHVSKLNNDVNSSSPSTLPCKEPFCEKTGFRHINSRRGLLCLRGRPGWRRRCLWTSWCLECSPEHLLARHPGPCPRPLLLSVPAGPQCGATFSAHIQPPSSRICLLLFQKLLNISHLVLLCLESHYGFSEVQRDRGR